ncbi:MAG: SH3 domain-containing protein [Benjaminiella poitrasii]|nr:MAG: SH3 domain-containing protein [Benjaminiella poitrasii]
MEKLVQTCHSLACTLESTLMATHSGIAAILQLTKHYHSLGHVFGIFSFLRWLKQRLQKKKLLETATPLLSLQEFERYQRSSSTSKAPLILFIILTIGVPVLLRLFSYQQKTNAIEKKKIRKTAINPKKLDFARALYSFRAESPNELSLQPNDLIAILSKHDPHWWHGRLKNGKMGYFPANHVEIIVKNPDSSTTAPAAVPEREIAPSA